MLQQQSGLNSAVLQCGRLGHLRGLCVADADMYTPHFLDVHFDQCLWGFGRYDMRYTRVISGVLLSTYNFWMGVPTIAVALCGCP